MTRKFINTNAGSLEKLKFKTMHWLDESKKKRQDDLKY